MLLTASAIATQYYRAQKKLYPFKKADGIINFIKMILCPPVAIRAGNSLSLDTLSQFHPVVLGDILLGSGATAFLSSQIKAMQYPLRFELSNPQALSIVTWFAAFELDAINAYIKREYKSSFTSFLLPPPWDGVSTAYCPRCSCQFAAFSNECPDCSGVRMLPIEPVSEKEENHA
jgi:hypothetical protein